jgi:hypothetical protein
MHIMVATVEPSETGASGYECMRHFACIASDGESPGKPTVRINIATLPGNATADEYASRCPGSDDRNQAWKELFLLSMMTTR